MSPYLIIACMLAVAGAGYGGFALGVDHELASRTREDKHITEAIDKATEVSAQAIAALKVKSTTIKSELQYEVRTNTVYADCKLTPGGLQLANQALAPTGAFAIGSGKLPKVDATER